MGSLMMVAAALTAVNCALLASLLFVYWKNYSKLKSNFTVGLALFAALFLAQNLMSLYAYYTMTPYFVDAVENYQLAFTGLQALAFLILAWLTWK